MLIYSNLLSFLISLFFSKIFSFLITVALGIVEISEIEEAVDLQSQGRSAIDIANQFAIDINPNIDAPSVDTPSGSDLGFDPGAALGFGPGRG
mgnify:CR=1 FL=1